MKRFWKKYGLGIQITVLAACLSLMVYYKFWEGVPEKRWLRWFQMLLFTYYLIDRVVLVMRKKEKTNSQ